MKVLPVLLLAIVTVKAQNFDLLPGVSYATAKGPLVTAVGDFNNDGSLDLAVGNAASSSISIYFGNKSGGFTAGPTISLPGCLVGFLSAGDFTHSGHTGLLAACQFQTSLWVLPGLGTANFGTPVSTALPQIAFIGLGFGFYANYAVADFNNDGILDLAIGLGDPSQNLNNAYVGLLLGKGDGTFQAPVPVYTTTTDFVPNCVIAADFNQDHNQDLLVIATNYIPQNAISQIEILPGTGTGAFGPPKYLTVPSGFSEAACAAADVNQDGIPDVIVSLASFEDNSAEVAVFLGAGDGTFGQPKIGQQTSGGGVIAFAAADLRGGGVMDLAEVTGSDEGPFAFQFSAGNNDGTFQNPVKVSLPSGLEPWWQGLVAGDWSGSGVTGLAVTAMPSDFQITKGGSGGSGIGAFISGLEALPAGDLVVFANGITPMPKLAVSKTQLQFSDIAGGAAPAAQSIAISNSQSGIVNWTATSDSSWLNVSPASGSASASASTPANLSISVSLAGLTPASYTGHVQITASVAAGSPQTVTVTLALSASSTAPVITGVVNGASFQPGFESGSWVTIQGMNLSNTNPGRKWMASEIVNGNLPESLDNTSVTIDGQPAYVYYISPTQLNVQAPTDATTGPVNIVVTNNGQVSAAFSAQLQTYSPAFFSYGGTSYAIASHYPDYALVGNPSVISGTIAAAPGDILIFWATGFGATIPPTPAGIVVTGVPAAAVAPTITIGGAAVTVLGTYLTAGTAGLYQITVQLPSSLPSGVQPIQATVSGVQSPTGILVYVAAQ